LWWFWVPVLVGPTLFGPAAAEDTLVSGGHSDIRHPPSILKAKQFCAYFSAFTVQHKQDVCHERLITIPVSACNTFKTDWNQKSVYNMNRSTDLKWIKIVVAAFQGRFVV